MKAKVNGKWRNIEATGEELYLIGGEVTPVENIEKIEVEDFEVSEISKDGEYPDYRLYVYGNAGEFDISADGGADLCPADNSVMSFEFVSGEATDPFGNTFEVEFGACERAKNNIKGTAV